MRDNNKYHIKDGGSGGKREVHETENYSRGGFNGYFSVLLISTYMFIFLIIYFLTHLNFLKTIL